MQRRRFPDLPLHPTPVHRPEPGRLFWAGPIFLVQAGWVFRHEGRVHLAVGLEEISHQDLARLSPSVRPPTCRRRVAGPADPGLWVRAMAPAARAQATAPDPVAARVMAQATAPRREADPLLPKLAAAAQAQVTARAPDLAAALAPAAGRAMVRVQVRAWATALAMVQEVGRLLPKPAVLAAAPAMAAVRAPARAAAQATAPAVDRAAALADPAVLLHRPAGSRSVRLRDP
jgi:hypothetical protein